MAGVLAALALVVIGAAAEVSFGVAWCTLVGGGTVAVCVGADDENPGAEDVDPAEDVDHDEDAVRVPSTDDVGREVIA